MCQYQTLYHDDVKGYVIHCQGCGNIQLAFGNVMLNLCYADFSGFHKWITRIQEEYRDYCHARTKFITVPTPYDGLRFLLNGVELAQLSTMLDEAETELKARQLLDLFGDKHC